MPISMHRTNYYYHLFHFPKRDSKNLSPLIIIVSTTPVIFFKKRLYYSRLIFFFQVLEPRMSDSTKRACEKENKYVNSDNKSFPFPKIPLMQNCKKQIRKKETLIQKVTKTLYNQASCFYAHLFPKLKHGMLFIPFISCSDIL